MSSSHRVTRVQQASQRKDLDNLVKSAHDTIVQNVTGFESIEGGNFQAFNIIADVAPQLTSETTKDNNRKQALANIKRRIRKLAKDNGFTAKLDDEHILAVARAVAQRQRLIEAYVDRLPPDITERQASEEDTRRRKEAHVTQFKEELDEALKVMFVTG